MTVLEAQPTLGGGCRTLELGLAPGLRHDLCSAVHPLAVASPFLRQFDLPARGVRLRQPQAAFAQPLDGRDAAVAYRDLGRTVQELGVDGPAWATLLGPLAARIEDVLALALGDKRSVPAAAFTPTAARFALRLLEQGGRGWGARFRDDAAPALLTGVAAHSIGPLPSLSGAGTALLLGSLAHAVGWPVPEGGSQAIADALAADLAAHGGTVHTGVEVTSWAQLPPARAYLFDTTPRALARIAGDRLPPAYHRAARRFRHGNGAAKVDFALTAPVPWADPRVAAAGTVHVGGTRAQMALAEAEVAAGRHCARPMTLVSQPATLDPTRVGGDGTVPLWTYAHVPAGSTLDVTEAVTAQIERFAPGFRDVVAASVCTPAAVLAEHNANYVGGDIAAGATTLYQMVARPTARPNPYRAAGGVYLCSASTPPGPGVHGLSGYFAATRALRQVFGIRQAPSVAPTPREAQNA